MQETKYHGAVTRIPVQARLLRSDAAGKLRARYPLG
jgi:hypothetical protein